jgi:maltose O-acetyltransferase
VTIGAHVTLGDTGAGLPGAPLYLDARHRESEILVSAHSRLTNGVELIALQRIQIGERCLVGAGVRIMDGDFHGVPVEMRSFEGLKAPVSIGSRVWIGIGALVLKGVSIGEGAVIGAGAVVSRDIPAGTVAVGNPAKPIRSSSAVLHATSSH